MISNWKTVTIGEFLSHRKGFAFKATQYKTEGHKIARVSNFTQRSIDTDGCTCIDEKEANQFSNYTLKVGDVVIATVGSWPTNPASVVGRAIRVPEEANGLLLNQNAVRLRSNEHLNQQFLYYLLSADHYQNFIVSTAQGSASQASIKLKDIFSYQALIPPPSEQEAIVSVVGALDDKIENNRRMNETLEEMARAIFKSWFVGFDPVHAKAAGNAPAHMDAETAALFPSSFGDDGLPVGWVQAALGDIVENPKRTVKPNEVDDSTPYIGLEHMPRNCVALGDWGAAGKVTSNKSKFEKAEFLFGKLRPYFHKVGVAPVSGICSTDILIIKAKEELWRSITIACISSYEFVNYTDKTATGTKMPRTNWKDMSRYRITLPEEKVARNFNDIIFPMLERVISNVEENQTLSDLRDTLLPKLMSGEIRVADAEREVESAL